MAIYKRGRGFELGKTENKSSKWPEADSNLGPRDYESNALTTRPRCLLVSATSFKVRVYMRQAVFLKVVLLVSRLNTLCAFDPSPPFLRLSSILNGTFILRWVHFSRAFNILRGQNFTQVLRCCSFL